MAVVRKLGGISRKLLLTNKPCISITRSITDEEYEEYLKPPALRRWMPSSYPATEEQRLKAAEKYNLHPAEYKPIPKENYTGDYPDLPLIGADARDPYYPWDYPVYRKNHGEPVSAYFDLMGEHRFPLGVRQHINYTKASWFCVLFISAMVGISYLSPDKSPPVLEKQYPGQGQHYTFELVN